MRKAVAFAAIVLALVIPPPRPARDGRLIAQDRPDPPAPAPVDPAPPAPVLTAPERVDPYRLVPVRLVSEAPASAVQCRVRLLRDAAGKLRMERVADVRRDADAGPGVHLWVWTGEPGLYECDVLAQDPVAGLIWRTVDVEIAGPRPPPGPPPDDPPPPSPSAWPTVIESPGRLVKLTPAEAQVMAAAFRSAKGETPRAISEAASQVYLGMLGINRGAELLPLRESIATELKRLGATTATRMAAEFQLLAAALEGWK